MGPDAPILPPGGASGPKLRPLHRKVVEPSGYPGIHRQSRRFTSSAIIGSYEMVRKVLGFSLIASTLLLAACNTVSGAGKDVSSAGKAVTNAADDHK